MRKKSAILILGCLVFASQTIFASSQPLIEKAPQSVRTFKEIAVTYPQHLTNLYSELTPQERVFVYYMFHASLPGNRIAADQTHRHALEIQDILEFILERKEQLSDQYKELVSDITDYLVYLWTNHGQYFAREKSNQKRTPARLQMTAFTEKRLHTALSTLEYPNAKDAIDRISQSLFDDQYEPTLTVPDSITKSAANYYSPDFTDADFSELSKEDQVRLNAYYSIETKEGTRIPRCQTYRIGGKYDEELQESLKWLEKALAHTKNYPKQFDPHFVSSLEYLCEYIKTGDEEIFKKHSIAWLKTNSRLDYCWGFIESYDDPKGHCAAFQAEVTIKSVDINKLNVVLPKIEAALPFPEEFNRDNLLSGGAALPNASINTRIFALGHLGPLNITIAYCLPNNQEIKAEHGSKQIIFQLEKGVSELLNADLYNRLFYLPSYYTWLCKHDPKFTLKYDLLNTLCILHETMGHGSGKFTTHTFKEGDNLTIEGKTHAVGDEIPVTSDNIAQFLAGYGQTIEELRAEILALYSAINNYEDLSESGIIKDWPQKIQKEKMVELFIHSMASRGLSRLISQQDDAREVAGDHAKANTTIMNYLVDQGGVGFKQEEITIDGQSHTVLSTEVVDLEKAYASVEELAILVQTIRSTGDGEGARQLIETYGKPIRHPEHLEIMKKNMKSCIGEIKVKGSIYPDFHPIIDESSGDILDVQAKWPINIVEQNMRYRELNTTSQLTDSE